MSQQGSSHLNCNEWPRVGETLAPGRSVTQRSRPSQLVPVSTVTKVYQPSQPVPVSTVTKVYQPSQPVPVSTVTKVCQPSQPVPETRVTQQPQTTQSEPTTEDLTKIFAEWTDLSLAVILAGKLESVLTQYIAWHIYTRNVGFSHRIISSMKELENRVIKKRYKKQREEAEILREKTSRLTEPLKEMLQDHKLEPFEVKSYHLDKINDFDWFENLETREKFSEGSFKPRDKAELKELALGLMHEMISVICSKYYGEIVSRVPEDFLKELKTELDRDTFRKKRNDIIHCRTNHGFENEQERNDFLKFYEETSKKFITEQDCFCLLDRDKVKFFYTIIIYLRVCQFIKH